MFQSHINDVFDIFISVILHIILHFPSASQTACDMVWEDVLHGHSVSLLWM
ncbi:UNVERIFIED_CONTAM: hypothetical protein FKN15_020780 [Acipenser sinensis]